MIDVSVASADIVAGRASPVSIRFTNTGRGPCFSLLFKLRLPAGVVLTGGSGQVEVAVLPSGHTHTHTITVTAQRPGTFELTSTNFSYRDENDAPVRVANFRVALVTAAAVPVQIRQPTGRLRVECEPGELDLGAWDEMFVRVANSTGVALEDVTVSVDGPFTSDGMHVRVAALADGKTARCPFKVNAAESGRHVPVRVRTTYSYRDIGAQVRTRTQEDNLAVVVRAVEPRRDPASTRQTVLYLAASPQDMPPLRSDVEMRKVKERLQLSPFRDQYRIEYCPASRFDDITQALIDYEPDVVHFSGHGDTAGNLCIEDDRGDLDLVTPEGLTAIFGQHRSTIRCVVVNACHSVHLAEIMATQIDHAVGMRTRIADAAAIQFSVGFYQALFAGFPVSDAFDRGCAYIRARPALEQQHHTPLLFRRDQ